ncbi:unnamed protein product, partial [marine sediment metagenome]
MMEPCGKEARWVKGTATWMGSDCFCDTHKPEETGFIIMRRLGWSDFPSTCGYHLARQYEIDTQRIEGSMEGGVNA